jgi:sulfate transport system ATP-binding protein
MSIEVRHLAKSFGAFRALDDVSLAVGQGELVALLGPSGCGKTTLLRVIAGLESPDEGSGAVLLDGEDVSSRSAAGRRVGFVFQHYALFRHMTVFDNIAFGLAARPRVRRPAPAEIRARVAALLELVQIAFLADRFPGQLSGGQRQRVALARALAVEPRVLLLDEPFGALDATVRRGLRRWLRRLHANLAVTTVFVTHDQEEALELADRVVLMQAGRIEQVGTPAEVYDRPHSPFVYHFLGHANLFDAEVRDGQILIGTVALPIAATPARGAGRVVACVRPHDLALDRTPGPDALPLIVRHVLYVGPVVRVDLEDEATGRLVEGELPRERQAVLALAPGERVFARPQAVRLFPADAPGGVVPGRGTV